MIHTQSVYQIIIVIHKATAYMLVIATYSYVAVYVFVQMLDFIIQLLSI